VISTVLTIVQALVAVVNAPAQPVVETSGEPTGIDQAGPVESVNEPATAPVATEQTQTDDATKAAAAAATGTPAA
jgi:hypothetical protein